MAREAGKTRVARLVPEFLVPEFDRGPLAAALIAAGRRCLPRLSTHGLAPVVDGPPPFAYALPAPLSVTGLPPVARDPPPVAGGCLLFALALPSVADGCSPSPVVRAASPVVDAAPLVARGPPRVVRGCLLVAFGRPPGKAGCGGCSRSS